MEYLKINREAWDKRTEIHFGSKFYDVNGFLNEVNSLKEIELAEIGDVKRKSLLHLQCHFGLDTLSWARKGAFVTGVDFSPAAIDKANEIKAKVNLEASFVCSDVYEYGAKACDDYDIVFTSYGVLCWLPCLTRWAQTITKSLKPGGKFYMVEFHPLHDLLSGYSYFNNEEPDIEEEGTYTENCSGETAKVITWAHPLSEVINALIRAGIQIDHVNEFPFSPYNCFDGLEERGRGRFYVANSKHSTPLVYSIAGTKIA